VRFTDDREHTDKGAAQPGDHLLHRRKGDPLQHVAAEFEAHPAERTQDMPSFSSQSAIYCIAATKRISHCQCL